MVSQDKILTEFYKNDGILSTNDLKELVGVSKHETLRNVSKSMNTLISKKIVGKVRGPKNTSIYFLIAPYEFIMDEYEKSKLLEDFCMNIVRKVALEYDNCKTFEKNGTIILKYGNSYQIRNYLKILKLIMDYFNKPINYILHDNYLLVTKNLHVEIDVFNVESLISEMDKTLEKNKKGLNLLNTEVKYTFTRKKSYEE
ncbi:MarR family transcriptional regulator [Methanococcus voltae]|uniref:Uncharacterized protein n=2 Tax=Methanococcus voltae TaxID=2188 RepID=A0A8J7USA0_METVO|nr:MarR family transcriptional regulator [Methanococcus voltae]MBP2172666.1 hypothetical protein [Methanococcus voltae]MBP2201417.1 hypothetical protein [Methanococcus voltae]MCS3922212.1 hypothetical protein [Methanococcus voltae PS]